MGEFILFYGILFLLAAACLGFVLYGVQQISDRAGVAQGHSGNNMDAGSGAGVAPTTDGNVAEPETAQAPHVIRRDSVRQGHVQAPPPIFPVRTDGRDAAVP